MASGTPAQSSTPTPILDGLAPLPQRRRSAWSTGVQILIGAIIGIAITFPAFVLMDSRSNQISPFTPLIFILEVYVAQYLYIIIHECGHLVAGLSMGLRLNFVRFGPLQINPPFTVSWWPKMGIGAAGLASFVPCHPETIRRDLCVLLLGGPLANLGAAVVVYVVFRPLSMFWGILAFICAVGVANLLPFVRRGAVSDGKRLVMVLRRTRQGERWLSIHKLSADLWKGVQPEDFDPEVLRPSLQFSDKLPDTVAIHVLAYASAFHRHEDAEAARLLEVALAHSAEILIAARESLITEATVFQARRAGNLESAHAWLKQLPLKTQFPGLREQGEAAILECESKFDEALARLEDSVRLTSTMPPGMQRDVSLRSLERWKQEVSAQKARSLGQRETTVGTH
jgi:hypothetical protein